VAGVAIVTDSTSGLPRDLCAAHDITPVSLYVRFPDGTVRPDLELDIATFYARLGEDDELPTTSPPEVEDFVAVYEALLVQGKSIVSVHISSGMSETSNVARQAATRLEEQGKGGQRIAVVDSASTGGGLALLALAAAAGAAAGEDSEAIVARVRAARQSMKNWLLLDTLEFLRRGGRIGGAAAWLGSRLQVKPILTAEAEIRAVERVRTAERGFERLVDFAHRLHGAGADVWMVQHAAAAEAAERLVERAQKIFRRPPVFVSEFSPVIATHAGPGSLLLAGMDAAWAEGAATAPAPRDVAEPSSASDR